MICICFTWSSDKKVIKKVAGRQFGILIAASCFLFTCCHFPSDRFFFCFFFVFTSLKKFEYSTIELQPLPLLFNTGHMSQTLEVLDQSCLIFTLKYIIRDNSRKLILTGKQNHQNSFSALAPQLWSQLQLQVNSFLNPA